MQGHAYTTLAATLAVLAAASLLPGCERGCTTGGGCHEKVEIGPSETVVMEVEVDVTSSDDWLSTCYAEPGEYDLGTFDDFIVQSSGVVGAEHCRAQVQITSDRFITTGFYTLGLVFYYEHYESSRDEFELDERTVNLCVVLEDDPPPGDDDDETDDDDVNDDDDVVDDDTGDDDVADDDSAADDDTEGDDDDSAGDDDTQGDDDDSANAR